MFNTGINENYVFKLIKIISQSYCKVRLYDLGKQATEKVSGKHMILENKPLIKCQGNI